MDSMRHVWFCKRGLTLVELLVALAMSSILMSAIYTVYVNQVRGQAVQEASLELQQGIRAAYFLMKREIRTAGADPTGLAGAEIIVAEPDAFHFTRDVASLSGTGRYDGKISAPNENIRYKINRNGDLGRETCRPAGAGWNCSGLLSILNNVDILDFVYFDREGQRLSPAVLTTASGRSRIRLVQVTIVARYGYSGRGLLPRHTDGHVYRNQIGEPLVSSPFNDHNRRLKMTTAIACRNI